jgi:hypothetical protein
MAGNRPAAIPKAHSAPTLAPVATPATAPSAAFESPDDAAALPAYSASSVCELCATTPICASVNPASFNSRTAACALLWSSKTPTATVRLVVRGMTFPSATAMTESIRLNCLLNTAGEVGTCVPTLETSEYRSHARCHSGVSNGCELDGTPRRTGRFPTKVRSTRTVRRFRRCVDSHPSITPRSTPNQFDVGRDSASSVARSA